MRTEASRLQPSSTHGDALRLVHRSGLGDAGGNCLERGGVGEFERSIGIGHVEFR